MPYQTPSASEYVRLRRLQALQTDKKFDDAKSKAAGVLRSNHGGYYPELPTTILPPVNFLTSNKFTR